MPPNDWEDALDDFITGCKGSLEASTARFYSTQLTMLLRWCEAQHVPLADFSRRHMRAYLAHRATCGGGGSLKGLPVSQSTRRKDVVVAKVFFAFCRAEGYITEDPLREFKPPKAPKPHVGMPTAEQLRQLLDAIPTYWDTEKRPSVRFVSPREREFYRYRDTAIFHTLIAVGARIGEVLDIKLEDCNLVEGAGQIVIREAKDDEPRVLPMTDRWVRTVKQWRRRRSRPGKWWETASDRLFVTWEGAPIDDLGKKFRRYMAWAGLKGWTLHGIKHYAATTMYETAPWMAEAVTGTSHATLRQHYVHKNPEYVRKQYMAADPLGKVLKNR